jgi:hypothetical protein
LTTSTSGSSGIEGLYKIFEADDGNGFILSQTFKADKHVGKAVLDVGKGIEKDLGLSNITHNQDNVGKLFAAVGGEGDKIEKNDDVKNDGKVLKVGPFGLFPKTKPVEVAAPGFLLKVKVVAVLKFGIIIFGFIVNNILKMGITLGGVVVDKIINEDVGHRQNENVKIQGEKNNRDKNNGDQAVDPGLFDQIESDRGRLGKIADGLNGGMTFLFGIGFKVRQKIIMNIKGYFGDFIFETADRFETENVVKEAHHQHPENGHENGINRLAGFYLLNDTGKLIDSN